MLWMMMLQRSLNLVLKELRKAGHNLFSWVHMDSFVIVSCWKSSGHSSCAKCVSGVNHVDPGLYHRNKTSFVHSMFGIRCICCGCRIDELLHITTRPLSTSQAGLLSSKDWEKKKKYKGTAKAASPAQRVHCVSVHYKNETCLLHKSKTSFLKPVFGICCIYCGWIIAHHSFVPLLFLPPKMLYCFFLNSPNHRASFKNIWGS